MDDKLVYRGRTFQAVDQSLRSVNATQEDSLTADSLAVDTSTVVVDDYFVLPRLCAAKGYPVAAGGILCAAVMEQGTIFASNDYGGIVQYFRGGSLVLKHYVETIKRVGATMWQLNCISSIGLLLRSYHWGGVYTGEPLGDLISDIIGGIIPYTLDPALASTPIYGWLPKSTRRDNLREALFASGGMVGKDSNGDLTIMAPQEPSPYEISPSRIYMGGSVAGIVPASMISVTEHSYNALPNDETVTLFEGEASGSALESPMGHQLVGILVEFSEPMHNLQASGTSILESGANYAVISNSSSCTLTGQKYNHTQRVVTRTNPRAATTPNIVSSTQCGLVNTLNVESVADRLMAYYSAVKNVEVDIVVTREKPGDSVRFIDPWGDQVTGYIRKLDMSMSAIMKGTATIADGYIPPSAGNFYSNVQLITSDTLFSVPAEARGKIRVVLCSGGQGGENGGAGTAGGKGSSGRFGSAGQGGNPGSPGLGGRIVVQIFTVESGDTFQVHIGKGGTRSPHGSAGEMGEDSSFGDLTTANGTPSTGYVDTVTGQIYATTGAPGVAGGAGYGDDNVQQLVVAPDGTIYFPGNQGSDAAQGDVIAYGGKGGGAAVGANGGQGKKGSTFYDSVHEVLTGNGGDGGSGASAAACADATIPGSGGPGGHGGGGGGGGGKVSNSNGSYDFYGNGGSPGSGGLAGSGAPGFALVYY